MCMCAYVSVRERKRESSINMEFYVRKENKFNKKCIENIICGTNTSSKCKHISFSSRGHSINVC